MIATSRDAEIDALLDRGPLESRLELTAWLGAEKLTDLSPEGGTIRWDSSDRRGEMHVDVAVKPVDGQPNPVDNLGQALEARWVWPEIGIEIPCGRRFISEPSRLEGLLHTVQADPEGPARLARARWFDPGERVLTGTMASQINQVLHEVLLTGTPTGPWEDTASPATECPIGTSLLETLEQILDRAGATMRPAREGRAVMLARPLSVIGKPDWEWSIDQRRIIETSGAIETEDIPNRITVWFEEEFEKTVKAEDGTETTETGRRTRGWSEPLYHGPRRWDGPYGRVPDTIKLDEPVSDAELRRLARRELRERQERAATCQIVMRADPRVEFGDTVHIVDAMKSTDCIGRVTSVSLDVGSDRSTVTISAASGSIEGIPISEDVAY